MRKLTVIFHAIIFLILAISCEKNDNEIKDGFSLVINDSIGEYTASFSYPGLSHQIEKEELQQNIGRIWLGELNNYEA